MAEVISIIIAAIQVATRGAQIITLAREVYKVDERMTTLNRTLDLYKQRLEERGLWFSQCNREDVQQVRQAYEDAKHLVDEARGALGHVQGLRDDVYHSASSRSGIWRRFNAHHALDTRSNSLEIARVEFDKALYDLDMRILNLKLYLPWPPG